MSPEDIQSLKFFWSTRRRRYWNQCRRRYFLHYYMAPLGRCEDASPDCREIFELDRRVPCRFFPRIVICQTLKKMFQRGEKGRFVDNALRHLQLEMNKMLMQKSADLIVSELLDTGIPWRQTIEELTCNVRQAAEKVEENFWKKIQYLPMERRRFVSSPQQVNFMELTCCFVPVSVFVNQGELWVLEGCSVKNDGNRISCLHRMYAFNELRHDPMRVRSLYLDEQYELKQLEACTSVSAFLEELQKDVSDMKQAEMEGFVTLHDFPACPGDVCSVCQFSQFCAKKGTFAAKS